METAETNSKDYLQLTKDLIQQNKLNFTFGALILITILATFIGQYGAAFTQKVSQGAKSLTSALFSPPSDSSDVSELTASLENSDIDYISPGASPAEKRELGVVSENGQISAVKSSQVTYTQNKYIIQPGESLADVAEQVYGDKNAWVRIAQANNITDPDHIEVGMELIIPR